MNYRKIIIVLGLAAIAMVCFFPPQHNVNVRVGNYTFSKGPKYENRIQTDYYKLATWITGIAALTGAAFFIAGPRRRIMDADNRETAICER